MAFPQSPLGIKAELKIAGTWTDITALHRVRNATDVVISRGRKSEQGSYSPATCGLTINNRDGLFSNRNPSSTYYGLLPKNTQARVSVTESTNFLRLPNWMYKARLDEGGWTSATFAPDPSVSGYVSTTDKAVLDVVGDLDLRIEIQPELWPLGRKTSFNLVSKYENASNQRSWVWYLNSAGGMSIAWSTDGTNPNTTSTGPNNLGGPTIVDSTTAVPITSSRIALRVVIDVNNGTGGSTTTFYTSDSISGTWTQLGSGVIRTGVTSIFSSSANLKIARAGTFTDGLGNTLDGTAFNYNIPYFGRLYGFQMYNGIGGTLVAKLDPTVRTVGDTSWSDGLTTPNTWTVTAPAEVTNLDTRMIGEIPGFPQKWDTTGTDVYVPIQASGILRRLTQGASPIRSTIYRNFIQYANAGTLTGYWPMEDGFSATNLASAVPGTGAGAVVDVTPGPDSDLPGSAGVIRFNSSASAMTLSPAATVSPSVQWLWFFFQTGTAPATDVPFLDWYFLSGPIGRIRFTVRGTTGSYKFEAFDSTGASVGSSDVFYGVAQPNSWTGVRLLAQQSGGNVNVTARWHQVGGTTYSTTGAGFNVAGTLGGTRKLQLVQSASVADWQLAHVAMAATDINVVTFPWLDAARAFTGEPAGVRFMRLGQEEGITTLAYGDPAETELMGPQGQNAVTALLQECADSDLGLMFEPRDQLALALRTRASLYAQYGPALTYSGFDLSGDLTPDDDDAGLVNDATVSRSTGSSGRSVVATGTNSVAEAGRYDTAATLSLSLDTRTTPIAQHMTAVGTWPDTRYSSVEAWLQRSNFLTSTANLAKAVALRSVDVGGLLRITGLPTWLPPDDAYLLVQGYTETLKNRGWQFQWNTSPGGPYSQVSLSGNGSTNTNNRIGAGNSTVSVGFNSSATSFAVLTPTGRQPWTTSPAVGGNPLHIIIAGERMTVGAISAWAAGSQTFSSVTRSVNGVIKSHLAGESVDVFSRFYAALGRSN